MRPKLWKVIVAIGLAGCTSGHNPAEERVASVSQALVTSLPGSNFEIDSDANLIVERAVPSIDWANVNENRKADAPSGGGDNSFGNGSKEDQYHCDSRC